MLISIIAAMSENRVIGKNNTLPWHLPADLKHFKAITLGKPIIMGRKTYDSIGHPLPGRHNIVITSQLDMNIEGITIAHSLNDAISKASNAEEVMIIGGATIYEQALPLATKLYLTIIEGTFEGDAYFPEWGLSRWEEVSREDHHSDRLNYSFVEYTLRD